MRSSQQSLRNGHLRAHLEVVRQPAWVLFAVACVAFPTITGLAQISSVSIQAPIELFELGFELPSLVFPLLAVGTYVVAFSSETANRWILYVRTRTSLRRYLATKAAANALVTFAVFFAAVALWGVIAFSVGPAAGWAPNGYLPELTPQQVATLTAQSATFTQLTVAGNWLYLVVYSAWVGLWAALFATVAFLVLLLSGNRLLAFVIPIVAYWLENIALATFGMETLRSVTAVFPFAIVQQPIASAFVPFVIWSIAVGVLTWAVARRRGEVLSLL